MAHEQPCLWVSQALRTGGHLWHLLVQPRRKRFLRPGIENSLPSPPGWGLFWNLGTWTSKWLPWLGRRLGIWDTHASCLPQRNLTQARLSAGRPSDRQSSQRPSSWLRARRHPHPASGRTELVVPGLQRLSGTQPNAYRVPLECSALGTLMPPVHGPASQLCDSGQGTPPL